MKMKKIIKILILASLATQVLGEVDPGLKRWVRVGSLQSYYTAWGAERAWNASLGIYEGLQWPAWYWATDNFVIDRYWLACTDWKSPDGVDYPYKATTFISDLPAEYGVAMEISESAKFDPPSLSVDGNNVTPAATIDEYHDMLLPYDRIIHNVVNTTMGVTVTRNIYIFSQQYHDNYQMFEYTFENTGNTDADDDIELPNQVIHNFYMGQMPRYATCREGGYTTNSQMVWGKFQWVSHMGANYALGTDSLRAFWSWLGQGTGVGWDCIGGPDKNDYGRLTTPQFAGIVFIHADKSTTDPVDDPHQPKIIGWHAGDTTPSIANDNQPNMKAVWNMLSGVDLYTGSTTPMDAGIPAPGPDKTINPSTVDGNDGGGAAGFFGYGPYELGFGEKITIVLAEGISGLDREHCIKIGRDWYNQYVVKQDYDLTLPDGSKTKDEDLYKNTWFYTGKDSIMQTFSRAIRNYESGYNIPLPPLPPFSVNVVSEGDRISLNWAPSTDEGTTGFGGYRVYRATAAVDSIYRMIFECGPGTDNPEVVNAYSDFGAVRGIGYYYYVTAVSDGTENTGLQNPAGPLESNRAYTQTTEAAYLLRGPGKNLDDIRIVPNPYNIKALEGNNIQYEGDDIDKIMFYNIPGYCTIRIYTERGDLVNTIVHDNGSGDHAWYSVTKDRQVVVSGLYIAYIKADKDTYDDVSGQLLYRKGDSTYKKLIVIR